MVENVYPTAQGLAWWWRPPRAWGSTVLSCLLADLPRHLDSHCVLLVERSTKVAGLIEHRHVRAMNSLELSLFLMYFPNLISVSAWRKFTNSPLSSKPIELSNMFLHFQNEKNRELQLKLCLCLLARAGATWTSVECDRGNFFTLKLWPAQWTCTWSNRSRIYIEREPSDLWQI